MSDWFTHTQMSESHSGAAINSEQMEIGLEFSDELSSVSLSGCSIKPISTSDLWLSDIQVEPLAEPAVSSIELEMALEFSDVPYDKCMSGFWIKPISILSSYKTWSSLSLVLFLHFALACLLWCAPKPPIPNHKWTEVQLVSFNGNANTSGLSMDGSPAPAATAGPSAAEIAPGEKMHQQAPPTESKSLPAEKRIDTKQNTPLKKHAKSVPPQHKEEKTAAQHPEYTDSTSHSDTASEGSGQIARTGAGAEVASSAGSPLGSGVAGESNGPLELAFGAPDGPSFLHRVVPSYPASAKRLEKQGTVLLRVTIDERGRPAEVEVLRKAGFGLDEEAVRAVKECTFVPAKRNGKPLTCKALLPIRFVLKES